MPSAQQPPRQLEPPAGHIDFATVVAIGIVAYGLANLTHEGIGHGGACVAVGCVPQTLTSMSFSGDSSHVSDLADRFISAAGSLANVVAALPAVWYLRRTRAAPTAMTYAAWLFASINLMQATGYLLFSGVGGVGDWVHVVHDLGPVWSQRLSLAAVGSGAYWFTVRWSMRELSGLLGGPPGERWIRAYPLSFLPYVSGAALYVVSGVLNPAGMQLVFISAVAASLGGTSGFAWGPQLLRDPHLNAITPANLVIDRDVKWLIAAIAVIVPFVAVLGPGLSLK